MKRLTILAAATLLAFTAHAQNAPQSNTVGQNGSLDQQIIGDTSTTADHTQSHATQIGNAANANGAQLSTVNDTRDQNTNNVQGGAANSTATGANQSVTAGRADVNVGPSTSSAAGGQGGQGGAASSTGINGQQQGIAGSGNSANRNSQATNTSAGNGAGSGNRTDNTTRVDASDRSSTSYEAKTTVWAPVIHGAAAPALAAANLVMLPGVCGPRVWVERVPVVGKRFGVWGGQSDVEQGYDDMIRPEAEPFVQRGAYLIGHQVTQFTAVVGTSSAGSFSLGGYGKNGDGAQGGGAASGQLQQIIAKVQVRECVMATPQRVEPVEILPVLAPLAPRADRN